MQENPQYQDDIVKEVSVFFEQRIATTTKAGIDFKRLWLDPGIGFGKKVTHNLSLLKRIDAFATLGLPLMVGVSRKSFLGHVLNLPVEARQSASLVAAVYILLQGVKMIRTHDVQGTKEAVLLLEAILNNKPSRDPEGVDISDTLG